MALVSLLDVHHALGLAPLLDGAALAIERGERIGLIGRNGTGKSTLLRIVAGEIQPDRGTLAIQNGLRVGYVPQEPQFDAALSAFEVVASGLPSAAEISAYEAALHALGEDETPAALERLHRAQSALEAAGGWNHAHRVEAMLGKLGIDGSQRLGAMSGGQKRRVALAHALAAQPELLLLDEPTNHLDITAIRWLESLLVDLGCALLFVTHDRAFLDAVATRIVELDRGHLRSYPGNFSAYEVLKAQQLDAERLERERFDKLLSQEEVWIRKGVEARRTRSVARIERLVQMRGERAARRNAVGRAQMKVDAGGQSGRLVIEAIGVSKTMGERAVVRDLDLTVMRGDKLALLGDNGSGKTTLLRLMLGELAPDAGSLRRGTQLDVAYFDQLRAALDPDRTVRETIAPGSDWIEVNGTRKHVMSYLGDFLFPPARANSPVRSLSGGERNRLLLARLFARPANLLVLDEPTNDLDIETLDLLEELLIDYPGTVLLVSHDRRFIDRVVTQSLVAEGDGRWTEYVGGWTDVSAARQRMEAVRAASTAAPANRGAGIDADAGLGAGADAAASDAAGSAQRPRERVRLSYNEQRELGAMPERIAALETEQAVLTAALADPKTYTERAQEVAAMTERLAQVERDIDLALSRWEELEQRANAAAGRSV